MRDYKLKITVSEEEAEKIRCFTHHTKTQDAIIFEPRSRINIKAKTKSTDPDIVVPFGRDCSQLERLANEGLFTIAEGKVSSKKTEVSSVSIDEDGKLIVNFSYPVYLAEDIAIANFVTIQEKTTVEEATVMVDIDLDTSAIVAEDKNEYNKTKAFDLITGTLPESGVLHINFLSGITSFVDENQENVSAEPSEFVVTLT